MKYDLDTKVTTKRELTIFVTDEESGVESEIVIREGATGIIYSSGRSSEYDFKPMYDVTFNIEGREVEVTFFEKDLEEECILETGGTIE